MCLKPQYKSAILVEKAFWSHKHRPCNSDSFVKSQRLYRSNFNVGRHGNVSSRKTTANWVSLFRNAAIVRKKIVGSAKTVRTTENVEIPLGFKEDPRSDSLFEVST